METLAEKLLRKKAEITAAAPRIVLGGALAGLALVRQRIEARGLPGKRYSQALVPTFLFARQALNQGGRNYIKRNPLGNWAGLKGAEGLTNSHVTLAHSNRMWNSLTAVPGGSTGTIASAKLVSADREGAARVKHNKARYGDFLQPNAQETKQVATYFDTEMQRILLAP